MAREHFGDRLAQERRLKSVRDRRDIGQGEIAKMLGVASSSVSRWEGGATPPGDDVMEQLATYFGVTPAWLRYGTLPRESPEIERAREIPAPDPRAAKAATPPAQRAAGRKRR